MTGMTNLTRTDCSQLPKIILNYKLEEYNRWFLENLLWHEVKRFMWKRNRPQGAKPCWCWYNNNNNNDTVRMLFSLIQDKAISWRLENNKPLLTSRNVFLASSHERDPPISAPTKQWTRCFPVKPMRLLCSHYHNGT